LGIYAGLTGPTLGIYWDIPAGGPSGTWHTTAAFWSASSAGGSPISWVNGSGAVFSADDLAATGNFTVTLGKNLSVGNITYRGGDAGSTLDISAGTGHTITMVNPTMNTTVDPGTILVIEPVIAGTGNLVLESGTLVLTGSNTYTGGTTIALGVLSVSNDSFLGGPTGGITFQGGELLTTGVNFASSRLVTLNAVVPANILAATTGTIATYSGIISGSGGLQVGDGTNAGTVALAGANTYSGGATVTVSGQNTYTGGTILQAGILLVNNAQALVTGDVAVNGAVLAADPQPINVGGDYTQSAAGTLQLSIAGRAVGQFDTLNVGRDAGLNGTLALVNLGYHPQGGDKLKLIPPSDHRRHCRCSRTISDLLRN
jgi:fibronectin-binding autotransporter adhesin